MFDDETNLSATAGCGKGNSATEAVQITFFPDVETARGEAKWEQWPALAKKLTKHKIGAKEGQCFAAGTFEGDRRAANTITSRSVIVLDVEQRAELKRNGEMIRPAGPLPPPVADVAERVKGKGWAAVIYTTWSHTAQTPRYRVVLPLADQVDFPRNEVQHHVTRQVDQRMVLAVATELGLGEVTDASKAWAESPFYEPRHGEEGAFAVEQITGCALGWRPYYDAELVKYRAEEDLREKAKEEAAAMRKGTRSAGPIAKFNVTVGNDLSEMLLAFGYAQDPRSAMDFRSPYQTSQSYATRLYPDGHWVSLSDSDAAVGLGIPSGAGSARHGDAFDLYRHFKHKNDTAKAIHALEKRVGGGTGPFAGLSLQEIWDRPLKDPLRRVAGLIGEGNYLTLLYGHSTAGKTFLAVDLSFALLRGLPWFGLKTSSCGVLYVAREGEEGFYNRIKAYLKHHKLDPAGLPPFKVITAPVDMGPEDENEHVERVIATIIEMNAARPDLPPVGAVFYDNMRAVAPGMEENDSGDITAFYEKARAVAVATGASPIILDNTGKDLDRGARGTQAKFDLGDTVIQAERLANGRKFEATKVRDGLSDGQHLYGYELQKVELGTVEDVDGEPKEVASAVVVSVDVTVLKDEIKAGDDMVVRRDITKALKKMLVAHPIHIQKGQGVKPKVPDEYKILVKVEELLKHAGIPNAKNNSAAADLMWGVIIGAGGADPFKHSIVNGKPDKNGNVVQVYLLDKIGQ